MTRGGEASQDAAPDTCGVVRERLQCVRAGAGGSRPPARSSSSEAQEFGAGSRRDAVVSVTLYPRAKGLLCSFGHQADWRAQEVVTTALLEDRFRD